MEEFTFHRTDMENCLRNYKEIEFPYRVDNSV